MKKEEEELTSNLIGIMNEIQATIETTDALADFVGMNFFSFFSNDALPENTKNFLMKIIIILLLSNYKNSKLLLFIK